MNQNINSLTAFIQPLDECIANAEEVQHKLTSVQDCSSKIAVLRKSPTVIAFFEKYPKVFASCVKLPLHSQIAVMTTIALGQAEIIFSGQDVSIAESKLFQDLVQTLTKVDTFYDSIGGIVGYYLQVLKLMKSHISSTGDSTKSNFYAPPCIDIRENTEVSNELTSLGIDSIPHMAEIYAVGGAGDRLQLVDEKTKKLLPAARLCFGGKSLLEGLIQDLWAREYLYYKLYGTQVRVPILLMTSLEKNNDAEIEAICEENQWFGRTKDGFKRIVQPLVPVIAIDGSWVTTGPLSLMLKPGGHGVIWKLAEESQGIEWLKDQGKSFVVVRQINNPMAGQDNGLLVLAGYGWKNRKSFGFLTCPSIRGVSEGLIVLKGTPCSEGVEYTLSNIEYTDFAKIKAQDTSIANDLENGVLPANPNILFADIRKINAALQITPFPGMIINMKQIASKDGMHKEALPSSRLETTMQNIADAIIDIKSEQEGLPKATELSTFAVLNDRSKTLSVTKKSFAGEALAETPEGCFYDLMKAHGILLEKYCGFTMPPMPSTEAYIQHGPSFIFNYHPSLGPLHSIIKQKISHGHFEKNAELQLEIAEVKIKNLFLDGSCEIVAQNVMGNCSQDKTLEFSERVGKCIFENVRVKNKGIDREAKNCFWKNTIKRHESLRIFLEGDSEFIASHVTFSGNWNICVPHGIRAVASMDSHGKVIIKHEPLHSSWQYRYSIDANKQIIVTMEERETALSLR